MLSVRPAEIRQTLATPNFRHLRYSEKMKSTDTDNLQDLLSNDVKISHSSHYYRRLKNICAVIEICTFICLFFKVVCYLHSGPQILPCSKCDGEFIATVPSPGSYRTEPS